MSLQVWLTGNNSMSNQGLLGELTQIVTPIYVDGKLGKAMSTGAYKMTAEQTAQVLNNKTVSICFWVYINADTGSTNNRVMFFGNDGMSSNNNRKFSLFNYPTVNDFHWSWMNDTANNTFATGVLSGVLPSYQWTHVAITYQNPNGTVYINGKKVTTFTGVSSSSTFAYETQVIYNSSYLRWNDYRIYDHALSAKEVKELAKGLVLHYRLAGPGQANLLTNSLGEFSGTMPTSGLNDFKAWSGFTVNANEVYTLSYEAKATKNGVILVNHFYNNASGIVQCAKNETSSGFIGNGTDGYCTNTLTTQYKKYWVRWTFNSTSTSAKKTLLFRFNDTNSRGETITIKNVKLEHGGIATPWCPNPTDALYNTMGYNNNIEYDCSGYRHNGTKSGNITWDIDSPRYTTSYNFSPHAAITTNTGFPIGSNTIFTFNIWLKVPSGKTMSQYGDYFSIKGSNLRIETSSTNGLNLWWFNYPIGTEGGMQIGNVQANSWYMHTLVCDGIKFYIYLNGKLKSTTTLSGTAFTTNGGLTLGDPSSAVMYFNLADARVYATALSADDIAELYHSAVIIDNTGKNYAYEYIEA